MTIKRYLHKRSIIVIGLLLIVLIIPSLCRGIRYVWLKQPPTFFPLTSKWVIDLGRSTYERPAYLNGLILMPADTRFKTAWYGLDTSTGRVVWSRDTGKALGRYNFRRCLTPDYLVISGQHSLYILNPQTGTLIWGGDREEGYYANTATCTDSVIVTGIPRSYLQAFSLLNGILSWTTKSTNQNLIDPVYNSMTDEIIAYGPEGILNIIDAKQGTLARSFERVAVPPYEEWRGSIYAIDQGQLFLGGTVLNATIGQVLHREDQFLTLVPPTLTDEVMYISSTREGVAAP